MDIAAIGFEVRTDSIQKGRKELGRFSQQSDKATKSMGAAVRAAKLAAGAFAGIKLTSLISNITMANSRFQQLGLVMDVVGRNASLSQDQVNAYAKEVEAMGISMTESRQTIIRMTQAQMDLSKASELARLAQDAAVIANTNSSDALGRLIYGLQSGQVEILRNMGLNVNFAASYSKLAAEMGITTDQLSEVDKVQARTNAVMVAGAQIAGAYDASMENAGKQLGSTTRYLQDLGVMWGEVFSEASRDAIFGYSDALKSLHSSSKEMRDDGTLAAWSENLAGAMRIAIDVAALLAIAVGVRLVGAIMGNVAAFGLAQLSALRYQTTLATMAGVSQITAVRLGIMSVAARTASASMALLGGPLGVITVAALALTYFATRSTEAEKEAKALDLRINSLGNSFDGLGKKQAAATLLDYTKKQENLGKELSIVSARAEYLNMQIQQFGRSPNADKWREDLIVIGGKQEDLVKQMEAGNKAMSELKRIMDSDPLAPIVKGTESASEAFNTLNRQMDEQILKIKAKNDAELLAARINAGYIDGLLTSEGKLLVAKQKSIDLLIEQKKAADDQLQKDKNLVDNLLAQEEHYKRTLTLVGDVTEAQRLSYEMQHGALQGLLPQQQASLMLMAEQVDALNNSKHFWAEWSDAALTALTDFDTLAASVVDNFTSGFGNAFESMIIDSENLSDAMKTMAQGLVRAFVNAIGQMIAQWLAYQAVQLIVGKSAQTSAVSAMTANAQATSLQAGLAAFASTAAIPIVGPAAAPAAMAAALGVTQPMVGAVAASASAGLAGMAHDGMDSIPTTGTWLLEKGERVTTAETSAKLDRKLDQLGSNGQNVSIMQEIIIEGNASEQDVELLREAARQGAEDGYRAVYNDFRNNGPIRRSVGV